MRPITACSKLLHGRRRCSKVLSILLIILCIYVFYQIKSHLTDSLSNQDFIHMPSCADIVFTNTTLNCSGDPLQQWCTKEMNLCNSSLMIYNELFLITHAAILQTKYFVGKRLGGEDIQSVLNQAERDEYFQFQKGFLQLPCHISVPNGIGHNGHLPSILSSITSYTTCSNVQLVINETTIAVNRQDYANIYHTITDLYTVYLLCRFFQRDPKSVRILFLDAHPKGHLDIFWSQLFHSYTRLGHWKNVSSIFYKELIWSPPQPKSEIDIQQHRRQAPSFFADFREHTLKQFHINPDQNQSINCQSIKILFLGRRNYIAHPRNPSGKIARQLSNEKRILNDLKMKFANYSTINFTINYFEQLTIEEQLKIIVQTDVLIGVHGAGLTHVIFLKMNRLLIELASSSWHTQIHFELMASINHVSYHRCSITDGSPSTAQIIFDCTKMKITQMCPSTLMIPSSNSQTLETSLEILGNTSNSNRKR